MACVQVVRAHGMTLLMTLFVTGVGTGRVWGACDQRHGHRAIPAPARIWLQHLNRPPCSRWGDLTGRTLTLDYPCACARCSAPLSPRG